MAVRRGIVKSTEPENPVRAAVTPLLRVIQREGAKEGLTLVSCGVDEGVLDVHLSSEESKLHMSFERTGASSRYFAQGREVQFSHRSRVTTKAEDRFLGRVKLYIQRGGLDRVAEVLTGAESVRADLRVSLYRQVAKGLRPAAIVSAGDDSEEGLDHESLFVARLPFRVETNDLGKVVPAQGQGGDQLLYISRDPKIAERLRDLDVIMWSQGPFPEEKNIAMRREQGELLGYPACCVERFSEDHLESDLDECYFPLWRMFKEVAVGHPYTNFLIQDMLRVQLVTHVPCGYDCSATIEKAGGVFEGLLQAGVHDLVRSLLSICVVIWPDGELLPFRLRAKKEDFLEVEDVGKVPFRDRVIAHRRKKFLALPDAIDNADGLRLRGMTLEYRVANRWHSLHRPDQLPGFPPIFALYEFPDSST